MNFAASLGWNGDLGMGDLAVSPETLLSDSLSVVCMLSVILSGPVHVQMSLLCAC